MIKKISLFFLLISIFSLGFYGISKHVQAAASAPQCGDGIDNDGDGLIDIKDPQCHHGGNAADEDTFDPSIQLESNTAGTCTTCGPAVLVPPVVDAGPTITIEGTSVEVIPSSTASDSDGTVVKYEWTFVSGPAGSAITGPDALLTRLTNLVPGVYTFKLKVTDNDGLTAEDTMQVVVTAPAVSTGGGGGGGVILTPTPQVLGATTNTPNVVKPTPQVLGATIDAKPQPCNSKTQRCLQLTGGAYTTANTKIRTLAQALAKKEGNTISISKIGLNKPVLNLKNIDALTSDTWMLPWGSTPDKGSNTVIIAHSYGLKKGVKFPSTFYNLDQLEKGDTIVVAWKGKKYTYSVTERKTVSPTEYQIEDATEKPMLTIYGCGKNDNTIRIVVQAELLKTE